MFKRYRATRVIQVFTPCLLVICGANALLAQTPASADQAVLSMVKYSGALSGADGKPLTGLTANQVEVTAFKGGKFFGAAFDLIVY